MMLNISDLCVSLNKTPILQNISFHLSEHDFLVIAGKNGAGKTTLIKAIMGEYPCKGRISLISKNISLYSATERARKIGVMSQKVNPQFSYTVYEVVSLGRYAHKQGLFDRLTQEDKQIIEDSLENTQTGHLRDRSIQTLSGGEFQRVMLAKLFAQRPNILILDEPASHLDFNHQLGIFDILKKWAEQDGHAVIVVGHDFNFIRAYANNVLLLDEGKIRAYGKVNEVLTPSNLESVYHTDVYGWMKKQLSQWQ
ncbi:MAG: ABC transporter ATP-binding protein [Bacillota bacterium]|nr:ABC transporter ATP-binding protein [Bacillota bacterium]